MENPPHSPPSQIRFAQSCEAGQTTAVNHEFDQIIPRNQTGCIKYDRKPDLDPFWVADMDFKSPVEILDAIRARVDHGIFGYAQPQPGLEPAILEHLANRHDAHDVTHDWITHLGGLVPALSLAARAFCKPGDAVMTCTPVYPPFLGVHRDAPRVDLITVDHVMVDGRWEFDWDAMEAVVTPATRLFLLCNPQNPLGRVFSREEIERLARFCETHDLVLVSDEIHCDLIFDEQSTPHVSALNLPSNLRARTITLLSPSKTWNIAGLGYAYAVTPDDSLRRRFQAARGHTLNEINAIAYHAAEAAYRHGEPWRLRLLDQLRENRDELVAFINESACAPLHIHPGESTYLAWIDATKLGVDNPAAHFEQNAGLFLSDGAFFGWPGWFRFNFACPAESMRRGLEKIRKAIP